MIFDTATITEDGFKLFTEAVAGEKIVWGTCICSIDDAGTQPVAKGNAVSAYKSASTDIAYISCSMSNMEDGCVEGPANYFMLYAKKEGDAAENVVIRASVGEHTATIFPEYDPDYPEKTSLRGIVDFNVQLSQGVISTIDMTIAAYALASDLQALSERVVTAHSIDDDDAGDTQTIHGNKTFTDDFSIHSESHYGHSRPLNGSVDIGCNFPAVYIDDCKLNPSTNSEEIGHLYMDSSENNEGVRVMVGSYTGIPGSDTNPEEAQIYSRITFDGGKMLLEASSLEKMTGDVTFDSLWTNFNGNVRVDSGKAIVVGQSSVDNAGVVCNRLSSQNIYASAQILPTTNLNVLLGDMQHLFHSAYADHYYGNTMYLENGLTVGGDDTSFLSISVDGDLVLNGDLTGNHRIMSLLNSDSPNISMGSILRLVFVARSDTSTPIPALKAGEGITYAMINNQWRIYVAKTKVDADRTTVHYETNANNLRELTLGVDQILTLLTDFDGSKTDTWFIVDVMRTN